MRHAQADDVAVAQADTDDTAGTAGTADTGAAPVMQRDRAPTVATASRGPVAQEVDDEEPPRAPKKKR